MNFACLNKITLMSGSGEAYIQQAKLVVRNKLYPGLSEVAFYVSSKNTQDVYIMSLWYSLEQCLTAFTSPSDLPELKFERKSTKQIYFKLIWEYRLVNKVPQSSFLRMLTFPAEYPNEKLWELINYLRSLQREIPGLTGIWTGLSTNNLIKAEDKAERQLITRSDWISPQAQASHLKSELLKEISSRYGLADIKIEHASFDLRALVCTSDINAPKLPS